MGEQYVILFLCEFVKLTIVISSVCAYILVFVLSLGGLANVMIGVASAFNVALLSGKVFLLNWQGHHL